MRSEWLLALSIGLLVVSLSGLVLAVDGVIEISQVRAEAGGITPGDDPGLPVTVTESGSYRLTSNLVYGGFTHGIEVLANNVTLDLNGFAVLGPITCTGNGSSLNCVGPGGGDAITAGTQRGITVTNGTVRGGSGAGIELLGDQARVEGVRVWSCRGNGIAVGPRGQVSSSITAQNGAAGIALGLAATAWDSVSFANGNVGFALGVGARVNGSIAHFNGSFGGINGSMSPPDPDSAGLILGNVSYQNEGFGISVVVGVFLDPLPTGYGQNAIFSNTLGTVQGGVEIGTNVCNGNTTCP